MIIAGSIFSRFYWLYFIRFFLRSFSRRGLWDNFLISMGMKMKRASVWMSVGGEMLWFSVGFEVSEVVGREKRNVQKVEFALIRVEFWGPSV